MGALPPSIAQIFTSVRRKMGHASAQTLAQAASIKPLARSSTEASTRLPQAPRPAPALPPNGPRVTVHASRTTQGQRIHEETQMVNAHEQGGVVRLKAQVPAGEPVVLINDATGAEVLCRVKNIRRSTSNERDVELEFARPAPGFWDNCPVQEGPAAIPADLKMALPPLETALPGNLPRAPAVSQSMAAAANRARGRNEIEFVRETSPHASRSAHALLVLVALGSLVNGAVLGIWFYRQAQNGNAAAHSALVVPPPSGGSEIAPSPAPFPAYSPVPGKAAVGPSTLATEPKSSRPSDSTQPRTASRALERRSSPPGTPAIQKINAPRIKNRLLIVQSTEAPPLVDSSAAARDIGKPVGFLGIGSLATASNSPAPPLAPNASRLQQLKLIASTRPKYPVQARAMHIEGPVTLQALVDETGRVVEATVISGHPMLQEAARDAVQQFRYQPARLNGKPIATHTIITMSFDLNR